MPFFLNFLILFSDNFIELPGPNGPKFSFFNAFTHFSVADTSPFITLMMPGFNCSTLLCEFLKRYSESFNGPSITLKPALGSFLLINSIPPLVGRSSMLNFVVVA